jgi:uncharacterized protein with HEPN domain
MTGRREGLDYLEDMREAIRKIVRFIDGMTVTTFPDDDKTVYAVIRAIEVMGEAVKHVPADLRRRYPDIPWAKMAAMRDRLIHGYFGVDVAIVWETASRLIPDLAPAIDLVIERETAQSSPG